MYSLSSCWNSHRHTDGRAMLTEIREMGFEYAELSHGIRISLLPGVFEAVDAGVIKISTLHNFCPLPMGVNHAAPNIFKFTSSDRRERDNAYRHSVKTIETAARVGAGLVVLHMGCIDMKDYTDKLIEMVGRDEKGSPKFEKICNEVIEKREAKKEKYIELANEMLRSLVDVAQKYGVKLGIENREALEEIPLESDFTFFFHDFPGDTVRYWHDCGHAQIKHNLGFIDHAMHLESMSEWLHGFHVHDVRFPGQDHCPPGSGMIDWKALAPMVKPEHIKVLELSPAVSPQDALTGFKNIKAVWGDE
ncbi:MAG: sugar phosphate isomerase/epimerase [Verrucomicrobiota bacterium]|nr:sugar phosphate isomerase/epimerase [Verrucomicrobiota bacterium]